jgi:hypothetical protein
MFEHASAATSSVPPAAHPAFAAHAGAVPSLGPHVTAVTAPAEAVTMTHPVAAMAATPKAAARLLDPLGSSHYRFSLLHLDISN